MKRRVLNVALLVGVMVWAACGATAADPELTISVDPKVLDGKMQVAKVTVTATDDKGKPGSGNVTVTSAAGSLKDGATVSLANGTGTVDFVCTVASDALCKGSIRLNAKWNAASAAVTVSVMNVDAGAGGGAGGGSPFPMIDGGGPRLDGGTFDGGMSGEFQISVVSVDKSILLEGTQDRANVVFRLSTNTVGMIPIANEAVSIRTTGGTLVEGANTQTAMPVTDAQGLVTVALYVGGATRGTDVELIASAFDAKNRATIKIIRVQTINWKGSGAATINIASTGLATTTPVSFELKDPLGMPVPGVDVDFSVAQNSAAGCTVSPPRARSDMMGIATTTLAAGDSQGITTVVAKVSGLPSANSMPISVVIGQPSDKTLSVSCDRRSLGALQTTTPGVPRDLSTVCSASFTDRNSVKPIAATNVSWLAEVGTLDPTSVAAVGTGLATNMFTTKGSFPNQTMPLPGEPSNGANNPRDNFAAIVAALKGEEEFWDGSGSSNGVANGKWDPGEYFVDIAEPLVDSNDNGKWDTGEPFIDTDRLNCATGKVEKKNDRWDGPNGCWDKEIQIWRSVQVAYTSNLVSFPTGALFDITPMIPNFVAPMDVQQFNFKWYDPYFNRLAIDGIAMNVVSVNAPRGSALVTLSAGESLGHEVNYSVIRATETSPGVFTNDGTCDVSVPDSGFPETRCLRIVKFGPWKTDPSGGVLKLTGASGQAPLMDGGVAPATLGSFEIRAKNVFQGNDSVVPFQTYFQ
jgi:hypothetical protein